MSRRHRFLTSICGGVALASAGLAHAGTLPFDISYESESPGIQNSTSGFSISGVETFNEITASGGEQNSSNNGVPTDAQSFAATFTGLPTGALTGEYSNVQVASYGTYGGADDSNFAVAPQFTSYTLTLTPNSTYFPNGITYFGFWLSALDAGNFVSFYNGNTLLFTFDPQDVINAVNANADPGEFYGNPNYSSSDPTFGGNNDGGEPFVFLNFYAVNGTQFTKVVFSQEGGGGYESDNDTVGIWTKMSGTLVPVPEPATWTLMLLGVGAVGGSLRQRRRGATAVA